MKTLTLSYMFANLFKVAIKFHVFCFSQFSFPGGLEGKVSACNVGDGGSHPESGRSPGEGMATRSSIVAWRIPWMEEPGRLQSMGSQRVGHD